MIFKAFQFETLVEVDNSFSLTIRSSYRVIHNLLKKIFIDYELFRTIALNHLKDDFLIYFKDNECV